MYRWTALTLGFGLLFTGVAAAEDVKLPKTLVWTSFDVGSTGYNQSIAVGKALQDAYGTSLRVLPTSTDQSRLAPAKEGRVPFALSGSDVFYAFEGVKGYASPEWGPQALTALSLAAAKNCLAMGTAADQNIKTAADLKGKRVAHVIGSPALQSNVRAFLAFGGLTVDDVVLVDQPGYAPAWKALANGQIDAMTGLTTGGLVEQAAASAHGLAWIPLPHNDEEAWKRLRSVNPHFSKRVATVGANISKAKPLECAGIPYPTLVTYSADAGLVYNVTKAINLQADVYTRAEPGAAGWRAENQAFDWMVPYSAGAIKYYKEIGVWTDAMQKHNDVLLERGEVLAKAWAKMEGESGEDFGKKWLKARTKALEAAGLPVYFR